MAQSMPGIIIVGVLTSLLVGVIIGFYLRQSRVNQLAEAVQQSQKRLEALEQEHDQRLQAATLKLQQDYENQLAEKIERYQDQYEGQVSQIEAEYQARQSLIAQADPGRYDPSNPEAAAYGAISTGPDVAGDIEQRIRKQYETRLKEAAAKIQLAYEQHLKAKLAEAREAAQFDYDQRLAQALDEQSLQLNALGSTAGSAIATGATGHDEALVQERLIALETQLKAEYEQRLVARVEQYQDDMTRRMEQMQQDHADQLQMIQAAQPGPANSVVGGDATESEPIAALEARLRSEYDQRLTEAIAHHQDELLRRTQALEEDFAARLQMVQGSAPLATATGVADADLEARLRQEIEASLQAEYEQKLAEKIEHYQDELTQRAQELEQGLESRLQMLQPPPAEGIVDSPPAPRPAPAPLEADQPFTTPLDPLDPWATAESGTVSPSAETDISPQLPVDESEPVNYLGLDEGLNLESAEPSPVAEDIDENFSLDNLDDLLSASNPDDDLSDDLFDSLDDLSNLS
ncbi:MAG: hypothetical protein ACFCVD_13350 [Nodosilinea sp.]